MTNSATNPLSVLTPVFVQASTGTFTTDVNIPEKEDEYTPLYVGVQLMLDVIREKIVHLETLNKELQTGVEEKIALLQSIGDGVVVVNTTGKITFVNASGCSLISKLSQDITNKPWADVLHFLDANGKKITFLSNLTSTAGKNENSGSILTFAHDDGSTFPVGITVTPVIFQYELFGTIIVFRDVSKEKKLETLKDEFLALATHQLRSPLATMRWTLEKLLKDTQLSESTREKLIAVSYHNFHMIDLVNDILDVSRLNDLTFSEHKSPQILADLLASCLQQLKTEADEKHVSFSITVDENPSIRQAQYLDGTLLKHCFHNIISNAVKYSHENGTVAVSLHLENEMACLEVKDTGLGISKNDQQHMFEKFYRGQNVLEKDIPGTGLGLYVVKALVEKWGGTIMCESQESVGTTMKLCLPTQQQIKIA